jgi:hypothetical protein
MPGQIGRRLAVLLVITFCGLAGLALADSAMASTTYLRPNEDLELGSWSIVGTASAWDALNDNITPSETPTSSDYVTTSSGGRLKLAMETISLAGTTEQSITAWFYTPTADGTRLEVRTGSGDLLAKVDVKSTGWHSVSLKRPVQQWELDTVYMRFERIGGSIPKIYAAFLNLSYNQSATKVYWGSWIDGEVYGSEYVDAPWDQKTWTNFEANAGKAVSIVHFGQPAPWNQSFALEPLENTVKKGTIPMMDMDSDGVSLKTLNSGTYDTSIKEWAEAVAAYGKPFFFRWQWEMNLKSTQLGKEAGESPESYIAVWQRFHNIAESVGATNITWVWCPNVIFPESTSLKSLYPGNSYVDWTCMDGYNHGTKTAESGGWKRFDIVFSETYSALTSSEFIGHEKPIMIGETASTEAGGSKPEWIAEALGTYLPTNFPSIKAVLWFNWNITEKGTEWDWPIESSAASTASFANAISSPYYAENTFGSLTPLTPIQPLP